ncbi:MAG: Rpn family recombination-promoting nuclease/putative transposase, partial [Oscillospiraceae bacterium]|nr:Rpn family recombination-promoting nuclease/putative transposase [Oscillospiraceae bacterium]
MLSLKNDLIFKKVFGSENSKDITAGFLKSVLDLPEDEYESITLLDTNTRIDKEKGKYGILDLKLKTTRGIIINIEMQKYLMDALIQKILFYIAKMIIEQIGKSENYEKIKKVVCIVIVNNNIIPDKKYRHKITLNDEISKIVFTDLIEIHTIELKKLPKVSDNTKLYYWIKLI